MTKTLITSLLLSVAMGGATLAQTTSGPSAPAASTDTQSPGTESRPSSGTAASSGSGMAQSQGGFYTYQEGDQMLGSGLMGARVMGSGNEDIGEVNDLLLDRDGHVMAVVVGVGGFLGIGEKDVAIANDQLEFVLSQDTAATNAGTAATPAPGATTSPATGAGTTAGAAPATGMAPATGTAAAPGMATTPGGAATGTTAATDTGVTRASDPANGTATGMMGNGWGWSGAGIDHIQVNFTREQLEAAPAFETTE